MAQQAQAGGNMARVAIIGAGLGGIAAAVNLRRAGVERITIFEQSAGPGGTWWDNNYPGAECDIPIAIYSYSFMDYDWPRTHASDSEIVTYLRAVIAKFGLERSLRFNTRVASAVWDDLRHVWTVTTATGETLECDVVVTALGLLNVPKYPDWPGLERFRGPKFHSARWEHQHELAGKRVAVVGTGSTAAQVVPSLAKRGSDVVMFSREPAYIVQKDVRELAEPERRERLTPAWRRRERAKLFWNIEKAMLVRFPNSRRQRAARAAFLAYRDRVFANRPDLVAWATPKYPFACKRPVNSSELLPALTRENVQLVQRAVVSVTEDGVVDSDGAEHKVDALVMATGFQPWNFIATMKVIGRGNRSLHGVWGDQPEAFLGMQVPGFPNFFMMYGPNTNFFCITFMLERQAEYITRAVKRLARTGATAIEVRRGVTDAYNRLVDRSLSRKTLEGNCHNYYHSATGRNVVTYPWWGTIYALCTRFGGLACTTRRAANEKKPTHVPRERSHVLETTTLQPGPAGAD